MKFHCLWAPPNLGSIGLLLSAECVGDKNAHVTQSPNTIDA